MEQAMDAPFPTNTADLRQRQGEQRVAFNNLVATVPAGAAEEPSLPNAWSVKDLLAHVAAYERWPAGNIQPVNEGGQQARSFATREWNSTAAVHDHDTRKASINTHFRGACWPEIRAFAGESYAARAEAFGKAPEAGFDR